jgi:hypothetical protein
MKWQRFCTGRYKLTGGEGPFYCWILMTVYGNKAQLAFLTVYCISVIHLPSCNKYWLRSKILWDVTLCHCVTGSRHSFKTLPDIPSKHLELLAQPWTSPTFFSFFYFSVVHSMNFFRSVYSVYFTNQMHILMAPI